MLILIADYLKENAGSPESGKGTYIIPGVTLNVKEALNVYTGPSSSTVKIGYLVLPDLATVEITDGQHRLAAVIAAMSKMSEQDREFFWQDAVSFMLTCEDETRQVHQDFADCSKTKSIPPLLLTVYDLRQPVNGLVIDLNRPVPGFQRQDRFDKQKSWQE